MLSVKLLGVAYLAVRLLKLMTDKQRIELYYAEPILNQLGMRDSVVSADSPDLRYSDNGRIIGIEVVCCYPDGDTPGSFNKMESRTFDACREYSKKLKREGIKGVFAWVSFTDTAYKPDSTVSTKRFKQIVIQEIARKVAQNECERNATTPEGRDEYIEKMAAGVFDCKYVESVLWDHLRDSEIIEVQPVRTGYYMTLDAKYVLDCLDKKEKKLLRYKEQPENHDIKEYWLFICNPSNTFCDLEDIKMPEFKSSFDRVYITDIGRVLQLK